jgi:hypothetical protein
MGFFVAESQIAESASANRIMALREAKDCIVPDGNPALATARIQKLTDGVQK